MRTRTAALVVWLRGSPQLAAAQLDDGTITIGVPSGFKPFDPVTYANRRMTRAPLSSVSARLIDGEKKRRESFRTAPQGSRTVAAAAWRWPT
jgi:hypothetical protein